MNIKKVKTALKVATIINKTKDVSKKMWDIEWNITDKTILKDESGRVYLLVVDGEIYKIGASNCKGGIKKTISVYRDLALSGGPSIRTYGIHILISEELKKGNSVEFYLIQSQKINIPIAGLFGIELKENVSVDCKEIENKCLSEFFNEVGAYPKWNFQEKHESWPEYIAEACNKLNIRTTKNSIRNKKELV